MFTGYLDEVEPSHRNMDANAMEEICPSIREFKDNQEIELVIKVPLLLPKVTNWPVPTNGKEVAKFLGFAG